jgi:AcrR family transcriptional regulator
MSAKAAQKHDEQEKLEKRCPRDRIFDTARELFYRQGIHQVGVETIASEAGTTKMSLYRHFSSKDELVAECLCEDVREFWSWWDGVIAPHAGNPRKQLEALFDAFQNDTCEDENARGCPLANAAVELPEPQHPGRQVVVKYKAEQRRRLRELCQQMGASKPDQLGDALVLLMEGSYVSGLVFCADGPDAAVAEAARTLIRAHMGEC